MKDEGLSTPPGSTRVVKTLSFISHLLSLIPSACPRGAAWSARLPVTQDHHAGRGARGSNPVEGAFDECGTVRKLEKRRSSNLRDLRVRLPPVPFVEMRRLGIGEPNCLRPPQGGGARASPKGYAGSTPARRTEHGPFFYRYEDASFSGWRGRFDSRTGC